MSESTYDRLNLRLSPETRDDMEWIAEKRSGVPFAEVVRRAVKTERRLMEVHLPGTKLFVEQASGKMLQIILV